LHHVGFFTVRIHFQPEWSDMLFQDPVFSFTSDAHTCKSVHLLYYHCRMRGWDSLWWDKGHTKFHKNKSICCKV